MKKQTLFLVLIFIIALCANSVNAQGRLGKIGQKFTVKEADILFGKVITSVKVNKRALHFAVARAKDYVAFKIKNGRALVLNESRYSIMDESISTNPKDKGVSVASKIPAVAADEVVYYFSKSVLAEFLNSSTAEEITIEMRESVLSLNNGEIILERSIPCPPIC